MHWEFVIAGYSITGLGLLVYTVALIRKGKTLSKRVPPDRRRFLD
jgi:CcmD family protein